MSTSTLGTFSVSLAVKRLDESKRFYEALGFGVFGGDITQNWLIMKNGNAVIGLFQGMFEKNILTFNPGWDEDGKALENFTDIRLIQKQVKNKGISLEAEADEHGSASCMLSDPDGNPILLDQHL